MKTRSNTRTVWRFHALTLVWTLVLAMHPVPYYVNVSPRLFAIVFLSLSRAPPLTNPD